MNPRNSVCLVSILGPRPTAGYLGSSSETFMSFPYVDLTQGVRESSTPEYAQVGAFMKPGKFLTYTGRSTRTISLMLRIVYDGIRDTSRVTNFANQVVPQLTAEVNNAFNDLNNSSVDNQTQGPADLVVHPARWLAALKDSYTDDAGYAHAPPPVLLNIGSVIAMSAVVTSCDITWHGPWFHSLGGDAYHANGVDAIPGRADISITFSEVESPYFIPVT